MADLRKLNLAEASLVASNALHVPCRESCSSSLARVARLGVALFALFSLISSVQLLAPACAFGATWPVSAPVSSVQVAFHDTYTAGAESYAHSGLDIPASAGLQISTPLAGTVRFTGAVPSGDSRVGGGSSVGKTMRAVSIAIADGRVITLMPFASIGVKAGQSVQEGEALGTLAASGDVSSPSPHLHMGLKRDSTYYDPMSLFGAASSQEAADVAKASQAAPAAVSSTASGAAPAPSPAAESTGEGTADDLPAQQAQASSALQPSVQAQEGAAGASAAEESFGTISSGGLQWGGVPAACLN